MKTYQTKTGVVLRVIDGGLSETENLEAESIGGLDLFDAVPEFDDYSRRLNMIFGNASIILRQRDYIGLQAFELTVKFTIDAAVWTKAKNRHSILGGLTVDLSNYLSRFHGLSQHVTPIVDAESRAKNGLKTLVFTYQVSDATAYSMGLSQDESFHVLQRGA